MRCPISLLNHRCAVVEFLLNRDIIARTNTCTHVSSYSDEGTQTCGGFAGSKGHEKQDAETFASWGVDYLKLDGCYNDQPGFVAGYPKMGAALQGTDRNITYSCSWPVRVKRPSLRHYRWSITAICLFAFGRPTSVEMRLQNRGQL